MKQNNIRIVLYQPSHPGNIGASARAMWTMGLSRLYLVQPKSFPDPVATARASGAEAILEKAVVVDDLDSAIADCAIVIGTSAQSRHVPWPQLSPRDCAQLVAEQSHQQIAILFGPERTGLSNVELQRCHYQVAIPANPLYSSLNLAMAVQVIAYEIYSALMDAPIAEPARLLASDAQLQSFYSHLDQLLDEIDFRKPTSSPELMPKLKRMFNRAQLDEEDINLLRGIFKKILCQSPST